MTKFDDDSFGSRLRAIRSLRGLTQPGLAELCGWESQGRISNYERDEREPKLADIMRLARALNVDPVYLQYGGESPSEYIIDQNSKQEASSSVVWIDGYDNEKSYAISREWLESFNLAVPTTRAIVTQEESNTAKIAPGDTVLLDMSAVTVIDGRFYYFCVAGEYFLRMLFKEPGKKFRASSYNNEPQFRDFYIDAEDIEIIGRATARIGSL